jgi:hypothetical protein
MTATRAQKCHATDSKNPLQQAVILQRVLDYVGPGHWCFAAEVSSLWRDLYLNVAEVERQVVGSTAKFTCVAQMTLFFPVFASPSTARHAHACGLLNTTLPYKNAAGSYADIATLRAAHDLGMEYTLPVMVGAARYNSLAVVQFLHTQGAPCGVYVYSIAAGRGHTAMCAYLHAERCRWDASACAAAASNGHGSTLRWLREHGCPWHPDGICNLAAKGGSVDALELLLQEGIVLAAAQLTEMLRMAGAHSKLAAAQWLRAHGAAWPHKFALWRSPWPRDVIVWARAEGCRTATF